jgi:hypothetical protein
MHPDVSRQPLQGAREIDKRTDLFFIFVSSFERRLILERSVECPGVCGIVRDQFG